MKIIWLKDRKAPMFIIENNETQTLFLEISVLFFRHTNGATAVLNV